MLDELRAIMDNLYYQYGLIDEVVRLSQVIDELIYQEQIKKVIKCK